MEDDNRMQMLQYFEQYMPHGMCLLWQPWLLLLWGGSDLLIFLSYTAIPIALLRVLRGRGDIKQGWLVLLFAGFILLCGITHFLSIVTLWFPIYPVQGVVKLLTGLVSATTAVALFRLVPILISLPSPTDLERANDRLKAEIEAHKTTLSVLREAQHELEEKVARRTDELSRANEKLAITAREAAHRSRNLITVVSSMARQTARGETSLPDFLESLLGRLDALATATTTVVSGDSKSSAPMEAVARAQLRPAILTFEDRISISGDPVDVGAEAAQQISLAIHELSTNSQKHGSLAEVEGRVVLTWHVIDRPDGEYLRMIWKETELPEGKDSLPDPRNSGFGTRLLTQIVPITLQGDAERRIENNAYVYELTVPLSALKSDMRNNGDVTLAARIVDGAFDPAAATG